MTAFLLPSLLFACKDKSSATSLEEPAPVYIQEGAPIAGLAEGPIDVPVGSPMGGYTARCSYAGVGGSGKVDNRKNAYIEAWAPSVGIQTASMAEVLWLDNGDQNFIMINIDAIYSFYLL